MRPSESNLQRMGHHSGLNAANVEESKGDVVRDGPPDGAAFSGSARKRKSPRLANKNVSRTHQDSPDREDALGPRDQ